MRALHLALSLAFASMLPAQNFDTVIRNGRVIDPESGLDAVRDVGITKGQITAIAPAASLHASSEIDAQGLVVTPGFIDLHQHGQTSENYALKARDGVTSALEMEVGVSPVDDWYRAREGNSAINFGASVGHIPVRMHVMGDSGSFLPKDRAVDSVASSEQLRDILASLARGLNEGALGIGMGLAYVPGAGSEEIYRAFQLAASRKVPIFVHLRSAGPVKPGGVEALEEVMAYASASGASLHVVHVTSTLLRQTRFALELIEGARHRRLDFTTECYPYTAGMTEIQSAIFSEGWQGRNGGITFKDLQWAATGERLTAESFERYRKQGGMVAIHAIPEDVVRATVSDPEVIIASDGILDNGKGHPRAAGTYSRVLGKYVREDHALSLTDALRKMSLMPAQRLNLTRKGRLQVGADADITVFDPARVTDKATFENPAIPSEGVLYVLVNGVPVVKKGELQPGVYPGRGVRRAF